MGTYSELVVKSALICCIRILRCFAYYADPLTFLYTLHKNKQEYYINIQKHLHTCFKEFFIQKNIESLFQSVLLNVLS